MSQFESHQVPNAELEKHSFEHVLAMELSVYRPAKRLLARVMIDAKGRGMVMFSITRNGEEVGSATHLSDAIDIYNET